MLEQLRSLRRRASTISVWISKVWPSELEDPRLRYESYAMVDHHFVPHEDVVEPFAPNAAVHVLPSAADVVRFAPVDAYGPRGISVLGIGRRNERQHEAILTWAERNRALYLYDTVRGQAVDWKEHRKALADCYQHTNISICNYAKHDVPDLIGGLRVIPGRLFEGLAAGTIMLGVPPDEQQQERLFGQTVVEKVEAVRLEVPFGLRNRIEDLAKRALEFEELVPHTS